MINPVLDFNMALSLKRRRDYGNDTENGNPHKYAQRQAVGSEGASSPHYFDSGMELDLPSDTSGVGHDMLVTEGGFGEEWICYGAVRLFENIRTSKY
jgi:hypothetical protein